MSFYTWDFEFKKGPVANPLPKDDCTQKCEIYPGDLFLWFSEAEKPHDIPPA